MYTFLIRVCNVAEEPGSECRYKMGCLRVGSHPTLCYRCAIQRNNVIDQQKTDRLFKGGKLSHTLLSVCHTKKYCH